jgi:thiol-disulfide isomerase/thioredoxin
MSYRFFLIFAASILAIASGIALGIQQLSAMPEDTVSEQIWATTLPRTDGKLISLKTFRGKILVINFWAPWCAPCVKEIPDLIALQNEFLNKNVQFVGIGIDSLDNIIKFPIKTWPTYPTLVANIDGVSMAQEFGNKSKVIPFTVIIDGNGNILKTLTGAIKKSNLHNILLGAS